MATTYCSRCGTTAVYKAGEVCSSCRYKLRHPETIPASERPPEAPPATDPADVDVAVLLRVALAQAKTQQDRFQDALNGDGLFQADTLRKQTELARLFETLVELELKLRKAAKTKVQTNDERIDAVAVWAREQLPKAKRERLIALLVEA
jgi:uncharacterized Zn finger protein (UPF0148 family)